MSQELFESLLQSPVAQTAPSVIIDSLLKGVLLLSLAFLAALILRRSPPNLRHRIWILALTVICLLPLTSLVLPQWKIILIDAGSQPEWAETGVSKEVVRTDQERLNPRLASAPDSLPASRDAMSENYDSVVQPVREASLKSKWAGQWYGIVFFIWLMGAAVVMGRSLLRLVSIQRMVRRGTPLKIAPSRVLTRRIAWVKKVEEITSLLVSEKAPVPFVWGVYRPIVVLPKDAQGWPPERQEAVLCHEYAHIYRRDHLTILFAQLACAIHWMNPLVWLAARHIETERERSCDDMVLESNVRASEYARHLLAIVSQISVSPHIPTHLAVVSSTAIEVRLRAILDPRQQRKESTKMMKLATWLFILGITLPLSVVQIWGQQVSASDKGAGNHSSPNSVKTRNSESVSVADSTQSSTDVEASESLEGNDAQVQEKNARSDASPGGAAAQAIESIGDSQLMAIAQALRNQDWEARKINGNLSHLTDARIIEPLIQALRDDSPAVRRIAAWALGELGDQKAIEPLRQRLSDSSAEVRAQAAQSLGDIANNEPVEDLITALKDAAPQVRLRAAHALGDIGDPRALPALTTALNDTDQAIRAKAAWAIKEVIEGIGEDSLSEFASHPNPLIRERVAHRLGDERNRGSIPILIALLSDEASNVRNKAAWALGEIQSRDAVDALVRKALAEEEDIGIRCQAIRGLGEIKSDDAVPVLLRLLTHRDWRLRAQAADALGDIGLREATSALTQALNDDSEVVRKTAQKALSRIR